MKHEIVKMGLFQVSAVPKKMLDEKHAGCHEPSADHLELIFGNEFQSRTQQCFLGHHHTER